MERLAHQAIDVDPIVQFHVCVADYVASWTSRLPLDEVGAGRDVAPDLDNVAGLACRARLLLVSASDVLKRYSSHLRPLYTYPTSFFPSQSQPHDGERRQLRRAL